MVPWQFLQNQGFLISVTNDNYIQVLLVYALYKICSTSVPSVALLIDDEILELL